MSIQASISNANTDIKATVNARSQIIPGSVNILAGAGTVVGANFNSPLIIGGTLQGNTTITGNISATGTIKTTSTADAGAPNDDTASIRTSGGAAVERKLHVGNDATFYSNVAVTGNITASTSITTGGDLTVAGTSTFSSSPQIPGFKITSNTPNVRTELGLGTSASPKTLNVFTKITNSPNEDIVIESQRGPSSGGDISLICGKDFSLTSDTLTLNGGQMVLGSGLANMFKLDSTGTGMSNLINVNGATNQVTINGPLNTGTSSTADVKLGSSGGLIYDASQNMIGIGTSAPGYKLDVLGDVRFQGPNVLLNCGILDVPVSVFNTHRLGNKIRTNVLESNTVDLKITGLPTYDNESAATSAGLAQDTVYKTSTGELRIKL